MRTIPLAVILGVATFSGSAASAQTSALAPGGNLQTNKNLERAVEALREKLAQLPQVTTRPGKPAQPFVFVQPAVPAALPGVPKVVCGMTVLPVDPQFDALIRRAPPQDRTFTMRVQPPPACEQRR